MLNQAAAALIFPLVGTALLTVGIRRRRAHNRWNRRDDERLLHPGNDDDHGIASQPPGRGTGFIIVGVLVVLLGASHVLSYLAAWRTSSLATNELDIGQCITAETYSQGRMGAESVDCNRSDATLQLVSQGESTAPCPDGKRQGGQYPMFTNDTRTQCFILNLSEGQCYAVARAAVPVDCTDPTANVKVASRIEGTAEDAACDADAEVMAYPQPPLAFCLVAP